MSNIPRVPAEERLFHPTLESSGKKMMLRPEQKLANWMMYIVSKFCKAGEPVVKICKDTKHTTKAC